MGLALYSLTAEFSALADTLTGEEVTPDIEAELDDLKMAIDAKVGGCIAVARTLDCEAEAYRNESRRLAAMAQARDRGAERMRSYVAHCLDSAGIAKVTTDVGKVSVGNASRPSIRWVGDGDPPIGLQRVKIELDGTAAYQTWKAGDLPANGFEVTTSRVVRVS